MSAEQILLVLEMLKEVKENQILMNVSVSKLIEEAERTKDEKCVVPRQVFATGNITSSPNEGRSSLKNHFGDSPAVPAGSLPKSVVHNSKMCAMREKWSKSQPEDVLEFMEDNESRLHMLKYHFPELWKMRSAICH